MTDPTTIATEALDTFWQELLEKDDRTSPAEYPEMALITREELADFIARAEERIAKQREEIERLTKALEDKP